MDRVSGLVEFFYGEYERGDHAQDQVCSLEFLDAILENLRIIHLAIAFESTGFCSLAATEEALQITLLECARLRMNVHLFPTPDIATAFVAALERSVQEIEEILSNSMETFTSLEVQRVSHRSTTWRQYIGNAFDTISRRAPWSRFLAAFPLVPFSLRTVRAQPGLETAQAYQMMTAASLHLLDEHEEYADDILYYLRLDEEPFSPIPEHTVSVEFRGPYRGMTIDMFELREDSTLPSLPVLNEALNSLIVEGGHEEVCEVDLEDIEDELRDHHRMIEATKLVIYGHDENLRAPEDRW